MTEAIYAEPRLTKSSISKKLEATIISITSSILSDFMNSTSQAVAPCSIKSFDLRGFIIFDPG